MKRVSAAALWLALSCTAAQAVEFEMKGMRIGMSEAEFKKLNPGAACEKLSRSAELEKAQPPMPTARICSVPGFTLATQEAKRNQFIFYAGQLAEMDHTFPRDQARAMQAALTDKYGQPTINPGNNAREWHFDKDTSIVWRPVGMESAYMFVYSKLSYDYLAQKMAVQKRRAKTDM